MFVDAVRQPAKPVADARPFRVLSVTGNGRIQRALDVLWREHTVIACTDPAAAAELARQHDVDAVLCDQRVPPLLGVDLLRDMRQAHPRALRLLLADRPDARLLLDAVNEAEVFRLIDQPWSIAALHAAAAAALRAARLSPPLGAAALADVEAERVRRLLAVVVIEGDGATQQRLRDLLHGHYKTHFAVSLERALQFMEQYETGTLICSTGRDELAAALKALKQVHPHMSAIAIDPLTDLDDAIELINEAQIFRLLRRPFNQALCRPYVDAALARYWAIKQQPQSTLRVQPAESALGARGPQRLPTAVLNRIRGLPGRLHESEPSH